VAVGERYCDSDAGAFCGAADLSLAPDTAMFAF
jgi:hypothetical protein